MIARFHVGKSAFSKSYRYGPSTGRRTFREAACALGLVDVTSVAHVGYLVGPGYRRRVAA